jgi:hypothetical protein
MKLVTYTYVHRSFTTFSVDEYFFIEKQTIKIGIYKTSLVIIIIIIIWKFIRHHLFTLRLFLGKQQRNLTRTSENDNEAGGPFLLDGKRLFGSAEDL